MRSTQQEITRKVGRKGTLTSAWAVDWWKRLGILCLILAATAMVSPGHDGKPSVQTFTVLHSFDGTDGQVPAAGLAQATNGNLYGTAFVGGANGRGTIFKITPGGTLTTLYSFCSQSGCADGIYRWGLVQATNGYLYGTTQSGGDASGYGTVFRITLSGTLATLHTFCSESGCADGIYPYAGLVQATNGYLYGTTQEGGTDDSGTVFKITPSGTLTTLHSFCPQGGVCTDGRYPMAALAQATDGNFYGTGSEGGTYNSGTVFKITPSGTLTTLHSFDVTDGYSPQAALVQVTNGKFYGTTISGGANDDGTVFSIAVGLGAFVETEPTSGKVGALVKILGTDLTGATRVTFNGTPAVFKVVSSSLISATVPEGATSGKVEVTSPGYNAPLSSNVPFRVLP